MPPLAGRFVVLLQDPRYRSYASWPGSGFPGWRDGGPVDRVLGIVHGIRQWTFGRIAEKEATIDDLLWQMRLPNPGEIGSTTSPLDLLPLADSFRRL